MSDFKTIGVFPDFLTKIGIMMKILDFYILRTFGKPFIISLVFFTGLIIISNLFRRTGLLIERQIPPLIMFEYFLYQIPNILMLITPVAVLLACLFSLGSLAHDNEIIALSSSGINLYRIVLPIIFAAILISFLALGWNEFVIPEANQRLQMIKSQRLFGEGNISHKAENLSFRNDKGWFLTIRLFDKETMKGIEIKNRYLSGHPSLRIDAKKAKWINGEWLLEDGILRRFNQQGLLIEEKPFKKKKLQLWSPDEIWMISQAEKKKADDMSMKDLNAYIRLLARSGCKFNDKLVDLYLKISFPFANLIIALIGTSLALQKPKGNIAASFGLSILISFLYWEAIGVGRALGIAEKLPPLFSAWIAHIIFGITGVYLAVKARK
ncbi:MAG: LptF/LptG family permease [bacterium]|nr:LptF/LptG family permease [bacterium]